MNTGVISERIRRGRKIKGLTQAELAERLGISEMTVRRWEGGKSSPRMEEISMLSKELGTPTEYLLGLNNDTPTTTSLPKMEAEAQMPPMSYWGGIIDNARLVATSGQNLGLIYSLLADASETVKAAMGGSAQPVAMA